jgi:hypothetical protein
VWCESNRFDPTWSAEAFRCGVPILCFRTAKNSGLRTFRTPPLALPPAERLSSKAQITAEDTVEDRIIHTLAQDVPEAKPMMLDAPLSAGHARLIVVAARVLNEGRATPSTSASMRPERHSSGTKGSGPHRTRDIAYVCYYTEFTLPVSKGAGDWGVGARSEVGIEGFVLLLPTVTRCRKSPQAVGPQVNDRSDQ